MPSRKRIKKSQLMRGSEQRKEAPKLTKGAPSSRQQLILVVPQPTPIQLEDISRPGPLKGGSGNEETAAGSGGSSSGACT